MDTMVNSCWQTFLHQLQVLDHSFSDGVEAKLVGMELSKRCPPTGGDIVVGHNMGRR